MRTPSIKGLTEEDLNDIADLLSDAGSGIELKDVKPEGMQTLAAKEYASKFLFKLAQEFQNKTQPK